MRVTYLEKVSYFVSLPPNHVLIIVGVCCVILSEGFGVIPLGFEE